MDTLYFLERVSFDRHFGDMGCYIAGILLGQQQIASDIY